MTSDNKDRRKSKDQLIDELELLRQRVNELEKTKDSLKKTDEPLGDSRELDLEMLMGMKQLALEERYRALFENIPIETIIVDTEAKVTGTNQTQRSYGEQGPHVGQIMFKEYAERHEINMYEELMNCIKSGKSKEFPRQKYNGNFFSIWMAPFSGGAIITSIDVTDHVLLEESMRKSQKRALYLAQILDNVSQPLVIAYADGRLMTYNKAFCNLTGYTKEELRNTRLLKDLVPSKWHEMIKGATEKMLHANDPQMFEIECLHKDGILIPVEVTEYPLIETKGTPRSFYSLFTHIKTADPKEILQKDSKDRLREIYEVAPVMVCAFDSSGQCIFWNNACERWLGWKEEEAISSDHDILALIYPDPDILKRVKKSINMPDMVFREFTVRTKDGSSRNQLWSSYSVDDNLNICVGYDITKWESEEERLQQYISELQKVNAELSDYNIDVLHDLRAPLNAIQNYTIFFSEELEADLCDEHKVYLHGISKAAIEAREMTDGLLDLARIGQLNASTEVAPIGPFLRELVSTLDLPSNVHITVKDDWPDLEIESDLLHRIFWNLIDNAIKFNNSPHKLVELGWRVHDSDQYEFFIRDNGIGIKDRYHGQVFGVFERLHTREEYPGTGVGLAIVKKAVQQLGGSIRLESNPGEGSTFFVTLPRTHKIGKKKSR